MITHLHLFDEVYESDDLDPEFTHDVEVDRLVRCAAIEWEIQGVLTTHTYMALTEVGVDPDALIESFNNGGEA